MIHVHYSFHNYYELVRPLINLLPNLGCKSLLCHTSSLQCFKSPILKNLWVLPCILNITMLYSTCFIDPDSIFTISRIADIAIVVCGEEEHIDYYYLYLTRLNCFTIDHYGSYSCLPTLKLNIATSISRLTNDSFLKITILISQLITY